MLTVPEAIECFLASPDASQDNILQALTNNGATPSHAWQLYQFLPLAWVHILFQPQGVRFSPEYIVQHHTTNLRTRYALIQNPYYLEASVAAEEHVRSIGHTSCLIAVARHSAEFATIIQLVTRDSDLAKIILVEPVLFAYDPSWDEPNDAVGDS